MALENVLKKGTYSHIDDITVSKNNKNYFFKFYVYENSLKEKLILEKSYNFSCKQMFCKMVDKVYTTNNFTSNLTDIYYNNPEDFINLAGIYSVEVKEIEQLNEKGEITKKQETQLNRNYNYNFVYYNKKYYTFKNEFKEVSGIETDHFFDTVIYPSVNKNIIEILYEILFSEEPSYKEYNQI